MTLFWLVAVVWASPEISVESASLQLADGASLSVQNATKDAEGVVGTGVQYERGELVISADSTRWSLKDARGVFEGNVTATQAELRFHSQRVEVQLTDDGSIRTALATGGVEVQQAERVAKGMQARFANGRLVLTGNPSVRQAGSEMVGQEIVFVVGKETIECKQCTMKVQPVQHP